MKKLKPLKTKKQTIKYLKKLADQIEFTFLMRVAELLKKKDDTPELREERVRKGYLENMEISVRGWLDLCDMSGTFLVRDYFSEKYGLEKVKDSIEDWIHRCLASYQVYLIRRTPYRNPDKMNKSAVEVKNEEKREVPQ